MNIKSLIISCGLAVFILAQPVVAGPLEDGQAAFDSKDYATALKLWRPLAEQGDANAEFSLGKIYDYGFGVPQDYEEAVKCVKAGAIMRH